MTEKESFMERALELAQKAYAHDEVPVGAVIVKDGKIIASAFNRREGKNDATAHAEILCIRRACKKFKDFRLIDCDMYVTLEPCLMCMGAILNARIKNLYFGAKKSEEDALGSQEIVDRAYLNHKTNVEGGILSGECSRLLTSYFKDKRNKQQKN